MEAGATIVNDVSAGLADPDMLDVVAELSGAHDLHLVLMHRRGGPADMQIDPRYDDVLTEVVAHLDARAAAAEASGVPPGRIAVAPGIGFGKRLPHNLTLLAGLSTLRARGRPVVLGVSRKAFIAHLTGAEGPADRIGGTAAAVALAVASSSVDVVRVHDVSIMKQASMVAEAIAAAARDS